MAKIKLKYNPEFRTRLVRVLKSPDLTDWQRARILADVFRTVRGLNH